MPSFCSSFIRFGFLLLLVGTLFLCRQNHADRARIDALRREIGTIPTGSSNFVERMEILWEWYNRIDDSYATVPTPPGVQGFHDLYVYGKDHRRAGKEEFRLMDEFLTKMDIVDGRREQVARVWITPDEPVRAGEYTTRTLHYRVGSYGLMKGGSFSIHISNQVDWAAPQTGDPTVPNYISVATTGSAELSVEYKSNPAPPPLSYEGRCRSRVFVNVVNGSLKEGDEVQVVYGDTSHGSPGIRAQTISENDGRFYVESDYDAAGIQRPIGWGSVKIVGNNPHHIVLVVPSFTAISEKFPVKLRIEDRYRNVATGYGGSVQVKMKNEKIAEVTFTSDQQPVTALGPVSIAKEDTFFLTAEDPVSGLNGRSNPIITKKEIDEYLYWGELHGHTHVSDGLGQPEEYYEYARSVAFCDFTSLSDHDFWLTEREWKVNVEVSKRYHDPPNFVTLVGYEWTQNLRPDEGHHIVYFFDGDGPLLRIHEYPTIADVFSEMRKRVDPTKVLIIPHAHKPGTWLYIDPVMERLSEIYSKHGTFEWYGNRFSSRALVGFVAGSDEHSGHPGNSQQGYWEVHGGITAIYARKLDRRSIWEGMWSRRAYATTNQRIILDFRTDGGRMGDSLVVSQPPEFTVTAVGTGPIEKIDIIRNGSVIHTEDLMKPVGDEQSRRFLLKFSSSSDPGKYAPPLQDGAFEGTITLRHNIFTEFQPTGIDGWRDKIIQTEEDKGTVEVQTRGDTDGLIFSVRHPNRGELVYNGKGGVFRFSLENLPPEGVSYTQPGGFEAFLPHPRRRMLTTPATASLRPVSTNTRDRVTIRYKEKERLTGLHYYYIRITQLDQSVAWSTPIWITQE